MKFSRQVLTGVLLMWACCAQAVDGHSTSSKLAYSVDAGITLDDNITRAERGRDIFDDSVLTLEAGARYSLPVNPNSYALFRATLAYHSYQDFDELSNTRLGLDASYFYKPVLRFTSPEYFLRLRLENRAYASDQRDGSALRLALGLNKRITDILSMQLGYVSESIDADAGTFDLENDRLYVDLEYVLSADQRLYLRLARVDGEIVATTIPTTAIIAASSSIVRDDAFLDVTPNRFAYRLNADSTVLKLGDAISLDRYQGLDLSVLYYDTAAYGGNDYSGLILSVFYRYNFF